jgi:glycogen debranching enzyme
MLSNEPSPKSTVRYVFKGRVTPSSDTPEKTCSTDRLEIFHHCAIPPFFMNTLKIGNWTVARAHTNLSLITFLVFCVLCCLQNTPLRAEESRTSNAMNQLTLQTDSVGPSRFLAVHGRRALVQGYATRGLEVWGYPLQIISGYEVGFRKPGATTELKGSDLLRKITYEPEAVIRTYVGPDFSIQETIFVPLDEPSAIITYAIVSHDTIDIIAHFDPVLDLMWPAAIGGQSTAWHQPSSSYIITEPSHRFSAYIGSPDVITHDDTVNSAAPGSASKRFAFAMEAHKPGTTITVVAGLLEKNEHDPRSQMESLIARGSQLQAASQDHYTKMLSASLQIITPDASVNRAISWAQIALDQAWVCNPYLGCGLVAGYGPSRDARRPQYEWFFAGDGLTAIKGLLASGQNDRAKEALQFIIKYQDPKTGMIWHELSQSASFLDWTGQYPYMYVHVDISFDYLSTVAQYISMSGDTKFAAEHWASFQSAYNFCRSILSSSDGLPRIPSSKEGGNEQDRLTDELGLSVSWVYASRAFSQLATATGHFEEAKEAERLSKRAQSGIVGRYWQESSGRWIDGYTDSGKPVFGGGMGGVGLIDGHFIEGEKASLILNEIASSRFQTDWGARSIASNSPTYYPNSYAKGSVWGIGTAEAASTFWDQHRPATAFPIWRSLIQWNSLDSLGHLHEVLAGDIFHEQTESVPEQTWTSAALLTSVTQGLLGLQVDTLNKHFVFAPHLPAEWNGVQINGIRGLQGTVNLSLTRVSEGLELTAVNSGASTALEFSPEIPLGAQLTGTTVNGVAVQATVTNNQQDSHATIHLQLPQGATHCIINFQGGVLLSIPQASSSLGDQSRGVKITTVEREKNTLVIEADVDSSSESTISLRTWEKLGQVSGAELRPVAGGVYDLLISRTSNSKTMPIYRHAIIRVELSQ